MPTSTATAAALESASRLRLALMRLARRVRHEALGGDVTQSMLSALAVLDRHGPMTLGELAAAERVQPPSMTKIVARLEEAGLVIREVDPRDRRVAWAQVTHPGHRFVERSRSRGSAYLARRLRTLNDDERAVVEAVIPVLERLLEDDK